MKFSKTKRKKEEVPFIMKATELVENKKDYWKVVQCRGEYLCIGFHTAITKRNKDGFGKRYIRYDELEKFIPQNIKETRYNNLNLTKNN